jgi:hypothetical protein
LSNRIPFKGSARNTVETHGRSVVIGVCGRGFNEESVFIPRDKKEYVET